MSRIDDAVLLRKPNCLARVVRPKQRRLLNHSDPPAHHRQHRCDRARRILLLPVMINNALIMLRASCATASAENRQRHSDASAAGLCVKSVTTSGCPIERRD